jgi:probable rRNA maturation factor
MSEAGQRLRVSLSDEWGRPVRGVPLARWLARAAPSRARGLVSVALVSDARVRALNQRYRGKDSATDVLSFPSQDGPFLGDIVIARGVARRQARSAGHPETTELRILALHGLLHLLGYDHERDDGRMRRVEARLLRRSGLTGGLIERSHGAGSRPSGAAEAVRRRTRLAGAPRGRR